MIRFVEPTGPCSPQRVEDLEGALGQSLPAEFRSFLLETGGGTLEENVIAFGDRDLGLRYVFSVIPEDTTLDIQSNMRMLGPFPPGFLVVGVDDGGNSVLIDLGAGRTGSVWFWDHELEHPDLDESPLFLIDHSFRSFMERLAPLEEDR